MIKSSVFFPVAAAGWLGALLAVGTAVPSAAADETWVPPERMEYKGRMIARTMHWQGAGWLIRADREKEENASRMLAELGVKPGMAVCDLGSGNGYHTIPMAKLVGPEGKVYAVDIQPEMLRMLEKRAAAEGLENIVSVEGRIHDPMLPDGALDLILLVDVYHEFSHPDHMLRAMRRALKPDGRIVFVEFRAEDDWVPIKPEHKMTRLQVLNEVAPAGFRLAKSFDALPWQHMLFFERSDLLKLPDVESLPVTDVLPDPLGEIEGRKPESADDWMAWRRSEVLEMLGHYEYGHMPPAPDRVTWEVTGEDPEALGGAATMRQLTIRYAPDGAPPIHLLLFTPNDREKPAPVFLGLNFLGNHTTTSDPAVMLSPNWIPERGEGVENNRATEASRGTAAGRWPYREIVARGYAVATFYHGDIDPDRDDFTDGVHPFFRREGEPLRTVDSWGSLAAWAWGLHRVVDCLERLPDIDPKRIAVMGHSRNGKAALVAGAFDDRIALVVSNQSGCGGAALSRRKVGETVKAINDRFPHWFCERFRFFNEQEERLPVDQHHLVAAIAPRPVLVCSAEEDKWADPEGEFAALRAAEPVYRLLGTDGLAGAAGWPGVNQRVGGTLGYHLRPGPHNVGLDDWNVFLDFAEERWGKP